MNPTCWDCGGPCLSYKGSVHGWRCSRCVEHAVGLDRPPTKAERRAVYFTESRRRQETTA